MSQHRRSSTSCNCVSQGSRSWIVNTYNIVRRLPHRSVGQCDNRILERLVERLREIEGCLYQSICQLSIVCSDLIEADSKSSKASIEHEYDVRAVASSALVVGIQELFCQAYAISHCFITKL